MTCVVFAVLHEIVGSRPGVKVCTCTALLLQLQQNNYKSACIHFQIIAKLSLKMFNVVKEIIHREVVFVQRVKKRIFNLTAANKNRNVA